LFKLPKFVRMDYHAELATSCGRCWEKKPDLTLKELRAATSSPRQSNFWEIALGPSQVVTKPGRDQYAANRAP
jgi:hypothetical protein